MYLRHIIHPGTHTGHESDLTTELTQNSHIAYSSAKGYQHADQLKTGCDSDLHTYDRRSCCFSVVCSCKTDNGTWTNSPPGKDYKPDNSLRKSKSYFHLACGRPGNGKRMRRRKCQRTKQGSLFFLLLFHAIIQHKSTEASKETVLSN